MERVCFKLICVFVNVFVCTGVWACIRGSVGVGASSILSLIRAGARSVRASTISTIGTGSVRAGTIRAGTIRAGTIRARTIRAGTIGTGYLRAGTISTGTIGTGYLRASTIGTAVW